MVAPKIIPPCCLLLLQGLKQQHESLESLQQQKEKELEALKEKQQALLEVFHPSHQWFEPTCAYCIVRSYASLSVRLARDNNSYLRKYQKYEPETSPQHKVRPVKGQCTMFMYTAQIGAIVVTGRAEGSLQCQVASLIG